MPLDRSLEENPAVSMKSGFRQGPARSSPRCPQLQVGLRPVISINPNDDFETYFGGSAETTEVILFVSNRPDTTASATDVVAFHTYSKTSATYAKAVDWLAMATIRTLTPWTTVKFVVGHAPHCRIHEKSASEEVLMHA